jgi:hypothetical protein
MRGGAELIADRLRGYIPALVNVDLNLGRLPISKASIQIEDDDRLSSLDLRGVYGLTVAVSATDASRAHAVAALCTEAGAARVITTISQELRPGRFDCLEVTDTAGVFSWKK